jgi:hypothetical protein
MQRSNNSSHSSVIPVWGNLDRTKWCMGPKGSVIYLWRLASFFRCSFPRSSLCWYWLVVCSPFFEIYFVITSAIDISPWANTFQRMNVKRKATSSITAAVTSPTTKRLKQDSLTAFFGAPKVSKDVHTAPKVSFDKAAWIKTLTSSQRDLLR